MASRRALRHKFSEFAQRAWVVGYATLAEMMAAPIKHFKDGDRRAIPYEDLHPLTLPGG